MWKFGTVSRPSPMGWYFAMNLAGVLERPYGSVLAGMIHGDIVADPKHLRGAKVGTLHDDPFWQHDARMHVCSGHRVFDRRRLNFERSPSHNPRVNAVFLEEVRNRLGAMDARPGPGQDAPGAADATL